MRNFKNKVFKERNKAVSEEFLLTDKRFQPVPKQIKEFKQIPINPINSEKNTENTKINIFNFFSNLKNPIDSEKKITYNFGCFKNLKVNLVETIQTQEETSFLDSEDFKQLAYYSDQYQKHIEKVYAKYQSEINGLDTEDTIYDEFNDEFLVEQVQIEQDISLNNSSPTNLNKMNFQYYFGTNDLNTESITYIEDLLEQIKCDQEELNNLFQKKSTKNTMCHFEVSDLNSECIVYPEDLLKRIESNQEKFNNLFQNKNKKVNELKFTFNSKNPAPTKNIFKQMFFK